MLGLLEQQFTEFAEILVNFFPFFFKFLAQYTQGFNDKSRKILGSGKAANSAKNMFEVKKTHLLEKCTYKTEKMSNNLTKREKPARL